MFFAFRNKTEINKTTSDTVIWTLSAVAAVGLIVMCLLPRPTKEREDDEESEEERAEENAGPIQALIDAGKLFITKDMLLLSLTFLYTGELLGASK